MRCSCPGDVPPVIAGGFCHVSHIVRYVMQRMRSRGDLVAESCARESTRVRDFGPSLTQASSAMDCDINVIVRRFGIDNEVTPTAVLDPRYYGDFDMSLDLGTAMARIDEASTRFSRLPVALRNRFDNSPAKLWQFVMDPANAEACVEMGLLARRKPPEVRSSDSTPPGKPAVPAEGGSAAGA